MGPLTCGNDPTRPATHRRGIPPQWGIAGRCARLLFIAGATNLGCMNDADAALGARIRQLREQRRWTQQELGDLVGVHAKTISNWESGRNIPRSSMGALTAVFKVDVTAEQVVTDPVEAAIRASGLIDYRQNLVLAEYQRQLHQQRAEEAG